MTKNSRHLNEEPTIIPGVDIRPRIKKDLHCLSTPVTCSGQCSVYRVQGTGYRKGTAQIPPVSISLPIKPVVFFSNLTFYVLKQFLKGLTSFGLG